MALQEVISNISEKIHTTATVKVFYGDPVSVEGKTIIPVAKVRYGFGGGGGWGTLPDKSEEDSDSEQSGAGGGGGGGMEVRPIGIIEITTGETRYISFEDKRRVAKVGVLGMVLGFLLIRRWMKRR